MRFGGLHKRVLCYIFHASDIMQSATNATGSSELPHPDAALNCFSHRSFSSVQAHENRQMHVLSYVSFLSCRSPLHSVPDL
jgi:hypothetical protein